MLALLLQHFDETLWLKCHIQWLYLAVHGCKTYLNLNLNRQCPNLGSYRHSQRPGLWQSPDLYFWDSSP
jgi:hypothetical protein